MMASVRSLSVIPVNAKEELQTNMFEDNLELGFPDVSGPPQIVVDNTDWLFYLRNPKSGSTSLTAAMQGAHQRGQCDNVQFLDHWYFAQDMLADTKTFTTIREPCDRFFSQHQHLYKYTVPAKDPRTHESSADRARFVRALESPLTWAKALSTDKRLKSQFLQREPMNYHMTFGHAIVAWPQAMYVGKNTRVACVAAQHFQDTAGDAKRSIFSQVQKIIDDVPSTRRCVLPAEAHANAAGEKLSRNWNLTEAEEAEVCQLAREIYHEDFKLWRSHCES